MIGWAKDQGLAHVAYVGLFADHAKEPIAVGGVAVHHSTNHNVVFEDKTAVNAARRIAKHDVFAPFTIRKIARAEQITARDFQLGGQFFLHECCRLVHQGGSGHFGLIIQRSDKTKDRAVVFHAFTHGQNIGVRGEHLIIHMDAFAHGNSCLLGQFNIWTDAHSHDQQITGQFGPVIQQQCFDMAVFAQDFF